MAPLRLRRFHLLTAFVALVATGLVVTTALSQRRYRGNRFAQAERAAIAEQFVGATTNGQVQPGLFGIRSTGVSTQPVLDAARAFLAKLTVRAAQQGPIPSR